MTAADGGLIPFHPVSVPGVVTGLHVLVALVMLAFAAFALQAGQYVQTGVLALLAAMIATAGIAAGRIVHRR
jgi:hypothetical protein